MAGVMKPMSKRFFIGAYIGTQVLGWVMIGVAALLFLVGGVVPTTT